MIRFDLGLYLCYNTLFNLVYIYIVIKESLDSDFASFAEGVLCAFNKYQLTIEPVDGGYRFINKNSDFEDERDSIKIMIKNYFKRKESDGQSLLLEGQVFSFSTIDDPKEVLKKEERNIQDFCCCFRVALENIVRVTKNERVEMREEYFMQPLFQKLLDSSLLLFLQERYKDASSESIKEFVQSMTGAIGISGEEISRGRKKKTRKRRVKDTDKSFVNRKLLDEKISKIINTIYSAFYYSDKEEELAKDEPSSAELSNHQRLLPSMEGRLYDKDSVSELIKLFDDVDVNTAKGAILVLKKLCTKVTRKLEYEKGTRDGSKKKIKSLIKNLFSTLGYDGEILFQALLNTERKLEEYFSTEQASTGYEEEGSDELVLSEVLGSVEVSREELLVEEEQREQREHSDIAEESEMEEDFFEPYPYEEEVLDRGKKKRTYNLGEGKVIEFIYKEEDASVLAGFLVFTPSIKGIKIISGKFSIINN